MNKPIWTVLFVIALLWIAIGLLVPAHCQTVCVRSPLIPYASKAEREPLRLQMETMVQKLGFLTGCDQAQLELLVEPLNGTATSDLIYFVVQRADGVGTISLSQQAYGFQSWQVSLFPMGRVQSLGVRLGPDLRGNIKGVLKTVPGRRKSTKNL